jgi:hypothetical protein
MEYTLILQRMLEVLLVLSPAYYHWDAFFVYVYVADFLLQTIVGDAQDIWVAFVFIEICSVSSGSYCCFYRPF